MNKRDFLQNLLTIDLRTIMFEQKFLSVGEAVFKNLFHLLQLSPQTAPVSPLSAAPPPW